MNATVFQRRRTWLCPYHFFIKRPPWVLPRWWGRPSIYYTILAWLLPKWWGRPISIVEVTLDGGDEENRLMFHCHKFNHVPKSIMEFLSWLTLIILFTSYRPSYHPVSLPVAPALYWCVKIWCNVWSWYFYEASELMT